MAESESHYNCYIWSQANQDKGAAHSVGFYELSIATIHQEHFPTSCGVLPSNYYRVFPGPKANKCTGKTLQNRFLVHVLVSSHVQTQSIDFSVVLITIIYSCYFHINWGLFEPILKQINLHAITDVHLHDLL